MPKGALLVDGGAAQALLEGGKSLLPVGVAEVEGEFEAGDMVSVVVEVGRRAAGDRPGAGQLPRRPI